MKYKTLYELNVVIERIEASLKHKDDEIDLLARRITALEAECGNAVSVDA